MYCTYATLAIVHIDIDNIYELMIMISGLALTTSFHKACIFSLEFYIRNMQILSEQFLVKMFKILNMYSMCLQVWEELKILHLQIIF